MTPNEFLILTIIKKDKFFNRFLAVRKQISAKEIIFSTLNLIEKSNNLENLYYKIDDELK